LFRGPVVTRIPLQTSPRKERKKEHRAYLPVQAAERGTLIADSTEKKTGEGGRSRKTSRPSVRAGGTFERRETSYVIKKNESNSKGRIRPRNGYQKLPGVGGTFTTNPRGKICSPDKPSWAQKCGGHLEALWLAGIKMGRGGGEAAMRTAGDVGG